MMAAPQPGGQRRWWLLLLLVVIPFLVPIPLELKRILLVRTAGSRLHVLLFLIVTFLLYRRGPWRGRLVPAAGAALGLGLLVEWIQPLFGRHARWQDFSLDVVGVGLAVAWILWRERRRRAGLGLGVALILLSLGQLHKLPATLRAQYHVERSFPRLTDFETPSILKLWEGKFGAELTILRDLPPHGAFLRAHCPAGRGYPGAEMGLFPWDWSAYGTLAGEIRCGAAEAESVTAVVVVQDYLGARRNSWASWRIGLGPGWNRFAIPLDGARTAPEERLLDRSNIAELLIYVAGLADSTHLDIDDLELRP